MQRDMYMEMVKLPDGSFVPVYRERLIPSKVKMEKAAAPRKGTKLELAVQLITDNASMDRARMIELLQDQLGMSKAGASTYYYKARSMIAV